MIHVVSVCCLVLILDLLTAHAQEIRTQNGRVQGRQISVLGKDVDAFLGIPYAKPPVGKLRLRYPEPAESWEPEVKRALNIAPGCLQPNAYAGLFSEPYRQDAGNFNEDCLYLNVWRPSNRTGSLAVMIWIHGGSFTVGSTSLGVYSGQYLTSANDVIFVSIGYRLGALGFMYLGPDTVPGNMGLMDQRLAIKWTKDNIAAFEGDLNRITLIGLSAGASSVGHHVLSPLTRDFFDRAILQSGAPNAVWSYYNKKTGIRRAKTLSNLVGCPESSDYDMYQCLQSADGQTISELQMQVDYGFSFLPVVDGHFLPESPNVLLSKGAYKHCNILLGVAQNEQAIILAYMMQLMLNVSRVPEKPTLTPEQEKQLQMQSIGIWGTARDKALWIFYKSLYHPSDPMFQYKWIQQQTTDSLFVCPAMAFSSFTSRSGSVYMYRFMDQVSSSPYPSWVGATHTYELEQLFGLDLDPAYNFTEEDRRLSRTMMAYWTNFVKSGNPNSPSPVPMQWPKFDNPEAKYILLDNNLSTAERLRNHECTFIDKIMPRIPIKNRKPTTDPQQCRYPYNASLRLAAAMFVVIVSVMTSTLMTSPHVVV